MLHDETVSTASPPPPTARVDGVREWWVEAVVGGAVLLGGTVLEVGRGGAALFVVVATAVAVSLYRVAPGPALVVVWLTALLQLGGGLGILLVQLALVVVAYGTSRFGSTVTVWASGLSIPLGSAMAVLVLLVYGRGLDVGGLTGLDGTVPALRPITQGLSMLSTLGLGVVIVAALLAVPWALGLVVRMRGRAERSVRDQVAAEAARQQAEELARLREQQTRLARDVHDVVGHSLAVILAQAEAAQFRPESDTAAVRTTLENIAVSARQSLRDVRQVLSSTGDAAVAGSSSAAGLDALIDGVRAAGNPVQSTVVGAPRPLPPELEAVTFRVLQEMLTNALKHGRRGEVVQVERHWEGELRLEVRNVVDPSPTGRSDEVTAPISLSASPGHGLEGMRRRLESIGGRLDVRRRDEAGTGPTFTATAWVPLRSGAA